MRFTLFTAVVVSLFTSSAYADLKFDLRPDNIDMDSLNDIQIWLAETQAKLPPAFQKLNRTVTIEFNSELQGNYRDFYSPFCPSTYIEPNRNSSEEAANESFFASLMQTFRKKTAILGRTLTPLIGLRSRAHVIQLNPRFIAEIAPGDDQSTQYPCGHRTYYRLAQATLLHELMHVYDFSGPLEGDRISDDTEFQSMAGWYKRGILFPELEGSNHQTFRFPKYARTPDPYEFQSPTESVAVHFEYFTMDPDYACRKPVLYQYFKDKLNYEPYPGRSATCQNFYQVAIQSSSPGARTAIEYFNLDPSRLYAVHYFLADNGKAMMSRWGHSMFRLVFCGTMLDPVTKKRIPRPLGPDCMRDVGNHLIISYRAHITEPQISSIKGLNGEYPSQMFVLTLADVVKEYTVGELRDILSYPLVLTDKQKRKFLDQVMDQYWGYQGKYYFINNNCAVESMNLMKAVSGHTQFMDENIFTPKGLAAGLKKAGLLNDSLFGNLKNALKKKPLRNRVVGPNSQTERVYANTNDPDDIQREMKILQSGVRDPKSNTGVFQEGGYFYRAAHWGLTQDFEALKAMATTDFKGNGIVVQNTGNMPWADIDTMVRTSTPELRKGVYTKIKNQFMTLFDTIPTLSTQDLLRALWTYKMMGALRVVSGALKDAYYTHPNNPRGPFKTPDDEYILNELKNLDRTVIDQVINTFGTMDNVVIVDSLKTPKTLGELQTFTRHPVFQTPEIIRVIQHYAQSALFSNLSLRTLSIEEFIFQSSQTQFMKSVGERLFLNPADQPDGEGMPEAIRIKLEGMFELQKKALPWMRTQGGYGIPTVQEAPSFTQAENMALAKMARCTLGKVQEWVFKKYEKESAPLIEAAKNVGFLKTELLLAKCVKRGDAPECQPRPQPSASPSPTTPVQDECAEATTQPDQTLH